MALSLSVSWRLLAGALGAGALLCASTGVAVAEPPTRPPNCTAADVAGVASGVAAATSAYLFTHPDVNNFFTGLHGKPRDEMRDEVQKYVDDNPQVRADLESMRQPLNDIRQRCQWTPLLGQEGATP
jgi:hemophore-related protein